MENKPNDGTKLLVKKRFGGDESLVDVREFINKLRYEHAMGYPDRVDSVQRDVEFLQKLMGDLIDELIKNGTINVYGAVRVLNKSDEYVVEGIDLPEVLQNATDKT